ncbi:hypothetical protein SKAU_G00374590 [Synaphobranchus kaupii]|uniref:Uncharacterized protein n=1 Tax=Synaphobranchus kaupii TaxID=118154 RepID=A0A9Q1EGQ3_SYNKA|nr:hypothetical protein SKAU_G00374590 [Synaphobranchus kaupii]
MSLLHLQRHRNRPQLPSTVMDVGHATPLPYLPLKPFKVGRRRADISRRARLPRGPPPLIRITGKAPRRESAGLSLIRHLPAPGPALQRRSVAGGQPASPDCFYQTFTSDSRSGIGAPEIYLSSYDLMP